MNRKNYAAILGSVAREHIPDDVDLAPRILAQIQTRKGNAMRPRVKIAMAAVTVLLVLAFLLLRVPAVAAAMQRMLSGFLPGVGLVDVGTTRVLAEPVSVTRDGITVTVEQAVADSEHTVVVYSVEGLTLVQLLGPVKATCVGADEVSSRLRLPDGTEFSWPKTRGGDIQMAVQMPGESIVKIAPAIHEFPSVPADVNELTFVIPCLEYPEYGRKMPRNWEFPLALVPAPPDMVTYPVIGVDSTSAADQLPSTPYAGSPMTTLMAPVAYNLSLTVDRVVPLDDDGGYRLYGTLDGGGANLVLMDADMRLLDANGQEIRGKGDNFWGDTPGAALPVTFEAVPHYVPGPVTLIADSVTADILLADAPSFTLDIGEHPQIDQVWELNRDFQVEGYSFHIATARFVERKGEYGLDFQMSSSNPAVQGVILMSADGSVGRNGAAQLGRNGEPFSDVMTYEAGFMPGGKVTITFGAIMVTLEGPWQTTVTLPAVDGTPSP